MLLKHRVTFGVIMAITGASNAAHASTLKDFFLNSKVDGQIRAYNFDRFFGRNTTNLSAFSLGGYINAHTASLDGFSADAGFYTANSLGANSTNPDVTLMGKGTSVNALGQAYLQYQLPGIFMVRAGNQTLNTPWVNTSDSRLIPATYQGVFAEVTPLSHWNIYGMRIFRWKSRTSSDYYKDNLYYPATYAGDSMWGGSSAVLSGTPPQTQGILAFGTSYKNRGVNAQAWYYNYYHFANMFYGQASYTYRTGTGVDPFAGGQVSREWGSSSLLNSLQIDGSSGQGVNSTAWGLVAGVNYDLASAILGKGQLSWAYNQLGYHAGAVGGGAIISPYTVGYATDPLYTTSMIRGLVEMGTGNAWKVKWTQHLLDNRFLFIAAYAGYHLHSAGSANDIYGDLTYFPEGFFKGLSIRDRVEVAHRDIGNTGYFIYNRVMLTYNF